MRGGAQIQEFSFGVQCANNITFVECSITEKAKKAALCETVVNSVFLRCLHCEKMLQIMIILALDYSCTQMTSFVEHSIGKGKESRTVRSCCEKRFLWFLLWWKPAGGSRSRTLVNKSNEGMTFGVVCWISKTKKSKTKTTAL